ncbi:nitrate- and nitrite sensing domain-containing protein, partial [Streptomyces sp. XM4193]|uniref:sensor histidine kinase n=1 Tax=Streptomyces sp. XM4193 TaxID=2929782 RepID=UPI001FFAD7AB
MQGRFKRDSKAAAASELRGSNDRGSAPQRAQEDDQSPLVRNLDGAGADSAAAEEKPQGGATAEAEPSAGSRLLLRNWRISTRLVSLLALPVVAATALGAFRVVDANEEAAQLENMQLLTEMTQQATALAAALQEERDRSAGPMTAHGNAKDDAVAAPRERSDQAKKAFDEKSKEFSGDSQELAGVRATVVSIGSQLGLLKDIRDRSYENDAAIAETVSDYNRIIESLLTLSQDMAQATSNPEMINSTRALAAFSTSKEYASIQRAIISAGLANPDGAKLSENDRRFGGTAKDNEDAALARFTVIYGDGAEQLIKSLTGGIVNIASADAYASRVFKSADGIRADQRSYMDWYDQDRTKIDEMEKIETTLLTEMEQQARQLGKEAEREVILNIAFIVLVLGISLIGAFVVARAMVKSLRRLQDTAQEVSRRRLPELVKQLSESDPQEVDTTVESVGVHSRDEIGRVAAAFDDVHREAVRLAGEQALLRGNVNAMFTNLSRRSQGLIQRQLSLISELESREADPDQLASLFKLDHLATRMRRNGENLLVLAGEEPGRRWTRPVPLVDVLRAAASEVEQYERIELSGVPTIEVAGRVVNDLVHLLAELLENATSFSSPQTKVKVTGHTLPDGRVLVEIHDTGIGLSPEDLSAINERLNSPPTVDVSVSRRMGLFVVGRLSLRHGIRIQLRPSDSGGTTALVMLPVDVTQSGQAARDKAGPGGAGAPAPRLQKPQGGTPGTSRLGALPTRGQVGGGGARPALPGAGRLGGGPGGPGGP